MDKKDFYKEQGYVVFKNAIPLSLIDNCLNKLEKFKKSNSFFYTQSEHNWRVAKKCVDEAGLLTSSIGDFTFIPFTKGLNKAGSSILQSKYISQCLQKFANNKDFIMHQNMLFDKSTGTVDHIDSWYLDTNPRGYLIGAWIALEDISLEGGCFHVYPKSHLEIKESDFLNLNHDEFIKFIKLNTSIQKKKNMLLRKGDVMFWHPYLIHGSSLASLENLSRKSLTAHYYPSDMLESKRHIKQIEKTNVKYQNKLKKQVSKYGSYTYSIRTNRSKLTSYKNYLKGLFKFSLSTMFKKINKENMVMNRSKI